MCATTRTTIWPYLTSLRFIFFVYPKTVTCLHAAFEAEDMKTTTEGHKTRFAAILQDQSSAKRLVKTSRDVTPDPQSGDRKEPAVRPETPSNNVVVTTTMRSA